MALDLTLIRVACSKITGATENTASVFNHVAKSTFVTDAPWKDLRYSILFAAGG